MWSFSVMRSSRLLAALVGALLLTGCWMQSLHPIYTDDTVVFEESLVGNWTDGEGGGLRFDRYGAHAYRLTFTDDTEDRPIELDVHLTRIDDRLFLDGVLTDIDDDIEELVGPHVVPVHWIFRLELRGEQLLLSEPRMDRVKTMFQESPELVGHTLVDGRLILTDETAALRRFLAESLAGDDAWSRPSSFRREVSRR
ncbi:MAG TPA: hypothetical protein VGD06_10575 [Acidobacteriota bacterium]